MTSRMGLCATLLAVLIAGCKPQGPQSGTVSGTVDGGAATTDTTPAAGGPSDEGPALVDAGPQLASLMLEVVDTAGYQAELDRHKGKVVLVDFWATWCIPCRQKFPHNVELARKYADNGLAVISVSFDDPDAKDDAVAFLQEQHADFPNLISSLGAGSASMEAFDIDGGALPHYKLYNREGSLIKKFVTDDQNEIEPAQVEAEVRKALGLPAE